MTVLVVVTHDGAGTASTVSRAWHDRAGVRCLSDSHLGDVVDDRDLDLVVVTCGEDTDAGHRAARTVRSATHVALCLVTASTREADELLAFARGCEEYLTTRMSADVIRARLDALLARGGRHAGNELARFACVRIDPMMRSATVHDEPVLLTRTEFELLHALVTEQRRVVSRWELLERGWGGFAPNDHVLDVHMSRLRRKVLLAGGPKIGEPVPGVGYRIGSATCPAGECGGRLAPVAQRPRDASLVGARAVRLGIA